MEMTREIVERFCDICGKPVDGCGFIVAHGQNGDVIYESKVIGDYCPEHGDALLLSALRNGGVAERYDSFDKNDEKEQQKALEVALINDEYASSVQRCQQLERVAKEMYWDVANSLYDGFETVNKYRQPLEALGVNVDD